MRPKNLRKITTSFGRAYDRSKRYEQRKKDWQTEFFAACTQAIQRERRLPRKSVVTNESSDWVKEQNPGWRIIDSDNRFTYLLEKDPNLVPYTYINPDTKMVYQRGTQESGPSLDEERLKDENPDLYNEVTETQRVVKDPSTWTEDQMEQIQPYLIPGTIKAKLIPPRKAKAEELDSLEEIS